MKYNNPRNRFQHLGIKSLLAVGVLAVGAINHASAVSATWSGPGVNYLLGSNWEGGAVPAGGDTAYFTTTDPAGTLSWNGTRTQGNLVWNLTSGASGVMRITTSNQSGNSRLAFNGSGDLILIGGNITSGGLEFNGGTDGNGLWTLQTRFTTSGNLNVVNSGAYLAFNNIIETNGSTSVVLTKTGNGILYIGSNSSAGYQGDFIVSAGSMLLSGGNISNADTQITVQTGGTFGGNGTVRDLVVQNGGTFVPGGTGIGNIDALGTVTFNATSNANFGIANAGSFDTLTSAGLVTLDGNFNLSFGSLLADGTTIDLFLGAGGLAGAFDTINATGSYTGSFALDSGSVWTLTSGAQILSFDNATGVLSVAAVPEPAAMGLAATGLAFGLLFRRRMPRLG